MSRHRAPSTAEHSGATRHLDVAAVPDTGHERQWSRYPDEANTQSHPQYSAQRYTGSSRFETHGSMNHRTGFTPYDTDDGPTATVPAFTGPSVTDAVSFPGNHTAPTDLAAPAGHAAPARRGGAHRIPTPPTALKGRAAVLAVAAGAVVAAGQASGTGSDEAPEIALADSASTITPTAEPQAVQFAANTGSSSEAPQVLNVADPADLSQFSNLLAKGQRFSEERAAREAAARRPLFALPALGTYTSSFGTRWGELHAGVDIANAIGTPIYAVADGTVISSGPAAGFGMWVRLQHADGTITVYGHIDSSLVSVGQQVMAGDQIARMGNRGFSTGPHLHFEVHLPGEVKIDPLPWLATRGISLGPEID